MNDGKLESISNTISHLSFVEIILTDESNIRNYKEYCGENLHRYLYEPMLENLSNEIQKWNLARRRRERYLCFVKSFKNFTKYWK